MHYQFNTLLILLCFLGTELIAQNVHIPDANLKAKLVAEPLVNTNGDSEIQLAEAQQFSGTLDLAHSNIADLTGLEAFTNITGLSCFYNGVSAIDVSMYPDLESLIVSNNSISSLDVSNNPALRHLECGINPITALDVSNNVLLEHFMCNSTFITSLDVSNNPALTHLTCRNTHITSLNVDNNPHLRHLDAGGPYLATLSVLQNPLLALLSISSSLLTTIDLSNTPVLTSFYANQSNLNTIDFSNNPLLRIIYIKNAFLTTLDLSQNANLRELDVDNNNLSALDLRHCPQLWTLLADRNNIATLDLSSNTMLGFLSCSWNDMRQLNVKNGNNTAIFVFTTRYNPNLTCVEVDDPAYSIANWTTGIDATTSFNINCNYITSTSTAFLDETAITIFPNPSHQHFTVNLGRIHENITVEVSTLTGAVVYTSTMESGQYLEFDIKPSGMYLMTIATENGTITKKIVKE